MFTTLWEYHEYEAGENLVSPDKAPIRSVTSFFEKLNQDREAGKKEKTEKQRQALRP
jgi:hypothetical protein